MRNIISKIINDCKEERFQVLRDVLNPIRHLKEQSASVPDSAGLYLIFCCNKYYSENEHLMFDIDNEQFVLLYFGKAGGITQNGKIIKQGLNGRINNVTSDSSRNFKDIKRAKYWNIIMCEFNIDNMLIFYTENQKPQSIEDEIYSFLDSNGLKYPLLNKKRGRK